MQQGYANPYTVADAEASERAAFIRRTYTHLAFAIAAFVGLEAYLLSQDWAMNLAVKMSQSWLIVLGAFMVVSWIANRWAMSDTSRGMQYLGLGFFIVAEAIIFLPILFIATQMENGGSIIQNAGLVTGFLFAGLTAVVFFTKKDFSFMRSILVIASFVAMGVIVVSLLFGFSLGTLFAGAMILFASGAILYDTSNILHHYRTDQHVAASLSLFASVALLFWYVLRLFMNRN